MPTGALNFMQQHKLHGNILPQFEWGSWVLWHMGDAFKVYIDTPPSWFIRTSRKATTRGFSMGCRELRPCSTRIRTTMC